MMFFSYKDFGDVVVSRYLNHYISLSKTPFYLIKTRSKN